MAFTDAMVASADRPITLRMRHDLRTADQIYQGHKYVVVKEPLGLRYFRFREEEMAILSALDGRRSLNEVKSAFEKQFAPEVVDQRDLQQFIGRLHKDNLVVSSAQGQGEQLQQRSLKKKQRKAKQALLSILAIRFPGVDPERLLRFLLPWFRWMYHPITVTVSGFLMASALLLVLVQHATFTSRMPAFHEFFGPQNWLLLACVMASVKIIHEVGHGLTCKYFGGECHEIGLMLLVFTPCLYCDVSDSWMLRNKWQRMAIGAAGIYVELLLAAIATFVWWFSAPTSLVNQLALQVMFICSVSTVIFNGNPLLRYDGYYIFADWIEIPNLRQQASQILQRAFTRRCLGIETPTDPFLPPKQRMLLGAYILASFCYRWVVLVSIMIFLNAVLEPYDLKIVGQLLMLIGGISMIAMPLWQLGKFLAVPGTLDRLKWRNVAFSLAIVCALLFAFAMVPLPHRVYSPFEIRPVNATRIKTETAGQLAEVFVRAGDRIQKGDKIALLVNAELMSEIGQITQRQADLVSQIQQKRRARFGDAAAANELATLSQQLQSIDEQLRHRQQQRERLTLCAPCDGIVLEASFRPQASTSDNSPALWSGTPLDTKNRTVHLSPHDPICDIGDPGRLEAWIAVDQNDVRFVELNDLVGLQVNAFIDHPFESRIKAISRKPIEPTPRSIARQLSGVVDSPADAARRAPAPDPSYHVTATVPDGTTSLTPGMRGTAKIYVGRQTLAQRTWRFLCRTFRFEM